MLVREKHNVPPSSASNQAPVPSFKVGEFGVAIGGGIWVAARGPLPSFLRLHFHSSYNWPVAVFRRYCWKPTS